MTVVLGAHLTAAVLADGRTDPYYLRFTSPKQVLLFWEVPVVPSEFTRSK